MQFIQCTETKISSYNNTGVPSDSLTKTTQNYATKLLGHQQVEQTKKSDKEDKNK